RILTAAMTAAILSLTSTSALYAGALQSEAETVAAADLDADLDDEALFAASEAEDTAEVKDADETLSIAAEQEETAVQENAAEEIPAGMAKSTLTGEYVSEELGKQRPVAFMIDNVKDADPQSGLSQASVYFECEVESDLSRICAVVEDYASLSKIGPLRSCRDYFISLAAGLDEIYTHYGQAAYALPYLESDDVDNLSGLMSYNYNAFFRDGPHGAPHNAYSTGEKISELISTLGYRTEHEDDYVPMLKFRAVGDEDQLESGDTAAYVELGYPHNKPYFVYDEATGLYSRFQYGRAHQDHVNGEQLAVKNIILEYQSGTNYQASSYMHYHTTGKSRGKYISNGKAIDITWERKSFYEPAVYRTLDGKELQLNPGKTWVAVIRKDQLKNCMIGSSSDDTGCVASAEIVAEEEARITRWIAEYKANEESYLSKMAQQRTDNIAKHGGTKVEVGLP
ncbi:MAG: DUF3048 domain-containing protein, partial [Lachnospiraceae bacterium]|nr:DUF3048 domain-containing protein [Lachnospiraceae bacterium]